MSSQGKKLVSVLVLADDAPIEAINESITNVLNQTYKTLEVLVSISKERQDVSKLQERWNDTPNLQFIPSNPALGIIQDPLSGIHGDYVFYKAMGPITWLPRHIEHHLDLFRWDNKAQWSFSFLEFKNVAEQQQAINVLNWRIESSPSPQSIIIDELCHLAEFKPEWSKFVVSRDGGKTAGFFAGACLENWKPSRVAVPEEITVQMWVDPRPPTPEFGKPQSDENVNEEVVEGLDGQLDVKIELPTLVGSNQFAHHNKMVSNRLKDILPEKIAKIALKRTIGMGDVILVEPVIAALRKRYSNAEITLFTSKSRSCTEIVQHFGARPDITVGLEGEGELTKDFLYSQKGYDLRIDFDLSYESRKNVNYIDAYFHTAGFVDEIAEVDGILQVVNPVLEPERIPTLVYEEPRMIAERYVTVELGGSGWPGKEWDPEKWKSVLKKVEELGLIVAFVSNGLIPTGWTSLIPSLNANNDFATMMNYLRYADFHIGADNGPMHVAAALGKKCFVVAGAAIPAFTTKSPNVYQCVHPALQCLHCKGRQYYNQIDGGGVTFVAKCENSDQYACMKKLEENYVAEKFLDFYSKI